MFNNYIMKFIKNINEDETFALAAETAFFIILSIVPFIMFLVSLLDNIDISNDSFLMEYIVPKSVSSIVEAIINSNRYHETNSNISVVSLLVSAWAASNAIWALMKGVHKSFTGKRMKAYITSRIAAVLFTVAFVFVIILSFGALVMGRQLTISIMLFFSFPKWVLDIYLNLLTISAIFLFIISLYYFTPGYKIKIKNTLIGGMLASIGWVAASFIFEIYIANFSKYSTVYGGIGAFLALIIWVFVISLIILMGAEINQLFLEKKEI